MKQKKAKRNISIRWKLLMYFIAFLAFSLLINWIFQILLLNTFFEESKRRELLSASNKLSASILDENLSDLSKELASDCDMMVMIFGIDESGIFEKVNMDVTGERTTVIMQEEARKYFRLASENDGTYLHIVSFGGYEIPNFDENATNQKLNPRMIGGSRMMSLVCAKEVHAENGDTYLILLSTGLQPLNATVTTMKAQFSWIGLILIIAAIIIAAILYRKISKPLIQMNQSAKQLALGNYDANFVGAGFLETQELAETLNYASKELSKLDILQKELIANISHDLRTPLTMIKGYGEMMRDIPEENTPENMQVIIDETARLSDLVNDLLDLSKLQSGSVPPRPEFFNLSELLKTVMKRYEMLTAHLGYRILLDIQDDNISIFADRGMILQVLYNLINNAVNYTGEDRTVSVQASVNDGKVRVSVSDTGSGIAKEEIPNIWDRYYRVDKVHKRATIGTGLGLSIVKKILDCHGAAFGVNSTVGKGSTFWFEFPVIPDGTIQNQGENL